MLFYALVLWLASWSVDAWRSDYVASIQPYTYTSWGTWGSIEWCPDGSYAYGFDLMVESYMGKGDDSALNAVKLYCSDYCGSHQSTITSRKGIWGRWNSKKVCVPDYLLHTAQVRSEPSIRGDNTAVNNYAFYCRHHSWGSKYELEGNAQTWGKWTSRKDCPAGTRICGIQTQVQSYQGYGDDTTLNDAVFYCCTLKWKRC